MMWNGFSGVRLSDRKGNGVGGWGALFSFSRQAAWNLWFSWRALRVES